MATTTEKELRSLSFSSTELKALTGWPDIVIEEFLNLLDNIVTVAVAVDSVNTTTTKDRAKLYFYAGF